MTVRPVSVDEKFNNLKEEMFKDFFDRNPHYASYLGLHDPYDYLLPKADTAHVLENLKTLEKYVERLKKEMDYNSLSEENKIDWRVLEKAVEFTRFEIYEQRMHELNPDAFDEVGGLFFAMITRDYAPLEKRADAIIARLEKLPKYLKEFQSRFEHSKPVKLWTEVALESAKQIPGYSYSSLDQRRGRSLRSCMEGCKRLWKP